MMVSTVMKSALIVKGKEPLLFGDKGGDVMFEGKKNDDGKLKWHLLPSSIKDVVEVFNHGSVKYGDFNWMKGIKYSRLYNAIQRHLYAWFYNQEQNDKESNLHHLAHVVASCLMLLYFEKNMSYVEFDDREPRNAG